MKKKKGRKTVSIPFKSFRQNNLPSLVFSCLIFLYFAATTFAQTEPVRKLKSEGSFGLAAASSGGGGSGTVVPDLFTGTAGFTVPIEAPPSRKGMAPQVSLSYKSTTANGWVGVGWDLEVGAIERSGRFGVNYSGDDYVLRLAGATVDLVRISGAAPGDGEFRAKIESGFLRIKKIGTSWEVTDKTGTRHLFGQTGASRQDNPGNTTQIFKWCLDQVVDTNGNDMTFSYVKDKGQGYLGQIYLDRIDYAGNSSVSPSVGPGNFIKFYTEPRSDAPDLYTVNFRVRTAHRLKTIDVFANGNHIRTYKLAYQPNGSAGTGRSLLQSVQAFGKDATVDVNGTITNELTASKLPATTFAYDDAPGGWESGSAFVPVGTNEFTQEDGNPGGTQFIDLNGDGKVDMLTLVYSDGSPTRPNGWHRKAYLNTGNGWQEAPQYVPPDNQIFTAMTRSNNPAVQNGGTRFVDLNGDGKLDMITLLFNDGAAWLGPSGWYRKAHLNTGNGWQEAPQYVPPGDREFTAMVRFDPASFPVNVNPTIIYPGGTEFVELDGDGKVDMITIVFDDNGGWWGNGGWYGTAWLNTGSTSSAPGAGWQEAPSYVPRHRIFCKPDGTCTVPENRFFTAMVRGDNIVTPGGTEFFDLNGDGKADALSLIWDDDGGWWGNGGWHRSVYLNTPSGMQSATQYVPPDPAVIGDPAIPPSPDHREFTAMVRGDNVVYGSGTKFVDLNGDGKMDMITLVFDDTGGWWGNGDWYRKAWINTGNGWLDAPQYVPPGDRDFTGMVRGDNKVFPGATEFVDLNGDGLPDMMTLTWDDNGGWWGNGGWHRKAYLNTGSTSSTIGASWQEAPQYVTALAEVENDFATGWSKHFSFSGQDWTDPGPSRFIDLNGDGKLDVVTLGYFAANPALPVAWHRVAKLNTAGRDLLKSISNGIGGATTIGYTPSTQYSNPCLPFPIPVVSSITASAPTIDGTTLTSTTTYSYEGGCYYIPDRDFRGFHHVIVTGPVGPDLEQTITHTWFHQGNDTAVDLNNPNVSVGYMKGKPYRVKVTDGQGREFSKTEIVYTADTTAPHFNPPAQVDSWTCEGSPCDNGKRTRVRHASYDAFGSPTLEYHDGDLFDPTDDRTIARSFTSNQTNWIVGLPLSEVIYQGLNTTNQVAATYSFYDGAADCIATSTNTNPDNGNLTRVVRWLKGGVDVDTRTAYNVFGNPVCMRDANGNISTISYDGSGTFPTIVTFPSPFNHQVKTAYYGVDGIPADAGLYGQVKSVIDPSLNVTTTQYDSLGRKTRVDNPDGSWTTVLYNNLGGGVGVQHNRTDTAAGLFSLSYFDGLGRTVLEKKTGPGGKIIATKQEYNITGTVKRSSLPHFEGEAPKWKTFTYDAMGRMTKTVNPDGSTASASYGLWTVTGVDAAGHQKRESRDAYGRLRKVEEFTGMAPTVTLYATTNYEYDVLGNLLSVTDAQGNKTTMRYDTLGRKIAMSDPDMGSCGDLTALAPNPSFPWYPASCWNYLYDPNGNLIKQIDAQGTILEFTYDALNRVKTKAFSDRIPPSAPSSLTATTVSASQINISWNASGDNIGVKEYRVERCNNRSGTSACSNFIQITSVTTTSYSNTGLTDGMNYSYRIRAMDTSGNLGSYSSAATATTPDITPPSMPAGLTAGAFCSNRVDLSWIASTDNVGVTAYQLERCQGTGCTAFVALATVSAPETGYNDTGLTANTTYRYRVKARDAAGNWSGDSAPAGATTPPPPTAPSALSALVGLGAAANSPTQVNLVWTSSTAPPDNPLSYYEVERRSNNGAFGFIASPVSTSYNDTTVAGGVTYLYRVRAVDCSGGKSAYSNVDLATTIVFTDDPLVAGVTVAKGQHFTQLRDAVNAVRASAGLASATWTDTTLVGMVIKSLHIQELRNNLNAALTALGLATPTYTDPTLTAGVTMIKKAHAEEIRQAVK